MRAMATDRLAAAVVGLRAPWYGQSFKEVASTQDLARAAAASGAPDRSIFVAEYQRAGRGRQGRTWLAPPGTALLMSILFRETTSPSMPVPWRFTSLVSLSIAQAVDELLPACSPSIKWPNDLMLGDRKVAGVLAETRFDGR